MKYMTFNSSCSYAGVANMLEQYGVDTDDRAIAMGMRLPYLFTHEDGVYMAGPMLQSAEWFNLFLNSIGFEMCETEVPAEQVADYLKQQKTAMLGLQVDETSKHAVVYTGSRDEKLVFLSNKWEQEPGPVQLVLSHEELLDLIGSSAMVATLQIISPKEVDLYSKLTDSISVILQNLAEIKSVCSRQETVGALRSMLNTLFRPLLLDGISMLGLLGEVELANKFSHIQNSFLNALRQDPDSKVVLGDYISITEFESLVFEYVRLISKEAQDFVDINTVE